MFFELIFGPLTNPKCDLGVVEKAMFQIPALHSQLILVLSTSAKCDLDEVEKAMFQGLECILNLFSASVLTENAI